MAFSKIIVNGTTLIDLTIDTAVASDVAAGKYFHLQTGERVVGTASGSGDTYTLTTVVPQQTFTAQAVENSYQAALTYTAGLEEGESYLVTFDGEEYMCDCYLQWGSDYMVGDIAFLWQTSGYLGGALPFGLDYIPSANGFSIGVGDLNQHTVKVERIEFVDGPLDLISKSITANGTYSASSDSADGYSSVTVNVPTGGGTYQAKTNISPTTSSQTITPDSGYDALSSVQIDAMPTGTAGTPTATKGSVSNHSVTVTPSVTNATGYITGGTKSGTAVTVSASELVSGSETKTANGTYNVTNLASVTVAIPIVTYHTSSSAPTSSQGSDGDLWLVTA